MFSFISMHGPVVGITLQLPVVLLLALLSYRAAEGLGARGYRAVGLGWIFNLAYLIAAFAAKAKGEDFPALDFLPGFFNLAGQLCFFHAATYGRSHPKDPDGRSYRREFTVVAAVMAGAVLWEFLWMGLGAKIRWQEPIAAFPVAVSNAYILFKLADFFRDIERERLPLEGRSKNLVLATRGYALLQLFYIFATAHISGIPDELVNAVAFVFGLGLKLLIAVGIMALLQAAAKVGAQVEAERRAIEKERSAIAKILHELGTPIPQLEIQIARALERVGPNQAVHAHLESIYNTALRAVAILRASGELSLVSELTMPALQQRRLEENLTWVDTHHVNTLLEIARIAVKDTRDEQVVYHIQYAGRCCIECIKVELIQVLINILRNAHDAFPDGEGRIWITTSFYKGKASATKPSLEDQEVAITIRDNGEGISSSVREHIFHEGFSTRGRGRGFGMSIIRELVEKNHGTISIQSPVFPNDPQRPGTEIVLRFARVPCQVKVMPK